MTRHKARRLAVAASAVIAAALAIYGGTPAIAADAGPLGSVVNGNDASSTSGTNFDTVQISAPAACSASATRHVTKITGVTAKSSGDQAAADAWVGDNLYATSDLDLPGPLTVRSSNSWQGLADTFGQQLVPATYKLVLRCQDNLGTVIYEEWSGQVTFSSPRAWTGSTGAANATGSSPKATPGSSSSETPSETPLPDDASVTATPGTEQSDDESTAVLGSVGSGSESDSDSGGLAATGATVAGISVLGALFLAAGAGLVALSRRRRRDYPTVPTGR